MVVEIVPVPALLPLPCLVKADPSARAQDGPGHRHWVNSETTASPSQKPSSALGQNSLRESLLGDSVLIIVVLQKKPYCYCYSTIYTKSKCRARGCACLCVWQCMGDGPAEKQRGEKHAVCGENSPYLQHPSPNQYSLSCDSPGSWSPPDVACGAMCAPGGMWLG